MILQSFRMAFSSIMASKMRSFLTMLGIIIGVVAVVVLISLVNGATASVTSEIEGLGSNLLTVRITSDRYERLTAAEVSQLAQHYDSIGATAPSLVNYSIARHGHQTYTASVQGTTPAYAQIGSLQLKYGRFLKSPDLTNQTAVAIIGTEVADELFGMREVTGETIAIAGRSFTVVGVLEEGKSAFSGEDQKIIIPFTLAQRIFHQKAVTMFYASASSSDEVDNAEEALNTAMLAKYRQDEDAFSILNQASILDVMDSITGTLSLLLGGIAGISLLVGGIGIMNIMLVSVTERTREIGIRKAIGAGRKRILLQFLIESMVISVVGGVIGILFSGVLLAIISRVAAINFAMTGDVVALAVGFSMLVGVVFGLYPANKASKLHPIQALRTE